MEHVTKIRIKNFKNLEDIEIELKPLTFLLGPNGAGKSSFIKALLFLNANLFPLNTNQTKYQISENLDLGSFSEIVTNGDIERTISFEIELSGTFSFVDKRVFDLDNNADYKEQMLSNDPGNWINTYFHLLNNEDALNIINNNIGLFPGEGSDEFVNLLVSNEFNYLFKADFHHKENRENLISIEIIDLNNNSRIEINTSKIAYSSYVPRKNGISETIKAFRANINLADYKDISTIFDKDFTSYFNDFMGNYSLPRISSLDQFLEGHFPNLFVDTMGIEYFNTLERVEKINLYFEAIKFAYVVNKIIPDQVNEIISCYNLPAVRQYPKPIILLNKNRETLGDYFGFMESLLEDTMILQNAFFDDGVNEINHSIIRKLLDSLYKYQTKQLALPDEISDVRVFAQKYFDSSEKAGYLRWPLFIRKADDKYEPDDFIKYLLKNKIVSINLMLKDCGFGDYFFIDYDTKNWEYAKLRLFTHERVETNLANASSGLIQVFPILAFISLFGYPVRQLIIEQPELHLHPKLQGNIISIILTYLKNNHYHNKILLETHSEHMIRKVQVDIAKGNFEKDNVGVYYFNKKNDKTQIIAMELEESGFFKDPWPDGFFDDSYNLGMELLFTKKN